MHGYYASVSYVDAPIGRLLKTLDAEGLAGSDGAHPAILLLQREERGASDEWHDLEGRLAAGEEHDECAELLEHAVARR